MSNEKVIDIDKLQVLLNLIGKSLKLRYPVYGFEMLIARPDKNGYTLKLTCGDRDFDRELAEFGELSYELPTYSDLRQCLLSSGVLRYKNLVDFVDKLKLYNHLNKSYKFSLDTNMLYFNFISNYKLVKPSELVLVTTVGDEIEDKLNHKYKTHQISKLKKIAKYQSRLFDELWNRRVKSSRKAAYVALREYKYIMGGVADVLEALKRPPDEDWDNDRQIVETLKGIDKEGHVLPILLTADDSMVDLCSAEDLEYFKFDIPYLVEVEHCSTTQFVELIFNLAVVCGFVKLNSVIIFGEFKGKSSNRPNELKLLFLDDKLYNDFSKDLNICKRLMELGIEK